MHTPWAALLYPQRLWCSVRAALLYTQRELPCGAVCGLLWKCKAVVSMAAFVCKHITLHVHYTRHVPRLPHQACATPPTLICTAGIASQRLGMRTRRVGSHDPVAMETKQSSQHREVRMHTHTHTHTHTHVHTHTHTHTHPECAAAACLSSPAVG